MDENDNENKSLTHLSVASIVGDLEGALIGELFSWLGTKCR